MRARNLSKDHFIDDIIVYTETKEKHDKRLGKVLDRLRKVNLILNMEKCIVGFTELDFFGHHLSASGITPTIGKVSAIKRFQEPLTPEEVRSFLGLDNYVGKFIPYLATVTNPLRKLTRKDTLFEWTSIQVNAFNELKRYVSTERTVWAVERFHQYVYRKLFELVTDHKPLETIFTPRSKPCARIKVGVEITIEPLQSDLSAREIEYSRSTITTGC